jgi:uncharacterized membrane protein YhaH (DUF805 family)
MKMTFAEAVKSGFKNYSNFKGTATRTEFWYFYLFNVLLNIVLSTLDSLVAPVADGASMMSTAGPLYTIANIALVVPNLSLAFRRFHDSGFSAKWLLLWVLPAITFFVTGGFVLASGAKLSVNSTNDEVLAAFSAFIPTLLVALAVGIFQLVIYLRRTKTSAEGNKYAPSVSDETSA